MHKKAQIYVIDVVIAITIFLLVLTVFLVLASNITNTKENFDIVYTNTATVSSILMGAGFPENWDSSNVIKPGLTNENYRLDNSKWNELANINYSKLKLSLGTKHDILIYFEDQSGNVLNISGIGYVGKPGLTRTTLTGEDPTNLIAIRRFLIYESEIITMVVTSWD